MDYHLKDDDSVAVIKPNTKSIQITSNDHNRLRHLALDMNISLKTLISRLIDDSKELQMLKKAK